MMHNHFLKSLFFCAILLCIVPPVARAQTPTPTPNQSESSGFPQIIYNQLDQKIESGAAAKKAVLDTNELTLTHPIEKGVVALLKGVQRLKDGLNKDADAEFRTALKFIPKDSQLTPLISMLSLEANLTNVKLGTLMQRLKNIVTQYRGLQEWRPEQYALMLRILVAAKSDRLIAKTWGEYEAHVRPAHRKDELSRLIAEYLDSRLKTPQPEWIAVVESMASFYPYSDESRWAFQKLESLKCGKAADKHRYAPSLSYLSRLASNAVLDDGLKQYVYQSSGGPIRTASGDIRLLDPTERITFLTQARLYREALAHAENELSLAPVSTNPAMRLRRAKALNQLGQIQVRLNDWSSAARTFSTFIEEYADQYDYRIALENLADSLVRLRAHRAAAKIYAKLSTSPAADSTLHWHHFWNTYLAGDLTEALGLLDRPGYVPQRDRGIEGGLDYWRAKILDKLGKKQEADEIFKRILSLNGDNYYAILIQTLRPGMVEAQNRQGPMSTYDEGQEVQDEFAAKESFSAKLLANGSSIQGGDAIAGNRLDLTAGKLLQKWGDYRTARRLIRTLPWSQIVTNKMYPEVADLAFALGDFGYGLKAALLPDSPFKAVPSASTELISHIAKNNSDWRYVYPMAYEHLVLKYADEAKIDPFLILSLMRAESVYDPDARSLVGAQGLMQIMPFTAIRIARIMNDSNFKLNTLHVPEVNIGYATYYVRKLLDYYSGNVLLAVASYNGGPISVDRWLTTYPNLDIDEFVETMSFKETRRYVKSVLRNFNQYKRIYSAKQALTVMPRLPQPSTDQEIF